MGLTAYNCKVPLHAAPGTWGLPFMYHQYTCIKIGKTTVCGGQDRAGSALGGPGKPSNDHYVPGKCRRRPSNMCFESCMMRKWLDPRPRYGIPFGTDCQEYDDSANDDCWKKCHGK